MTRSTLLLSALTASAVLALPACSSRHDGMHTDRSHRTDHGPMSGMTGHNTYSGNGLAASADGYTLTPARSQLSLGRQTLTFQVRDSDGMPVVDYVEDQTKRLHLYLVRQDLTGYQHLHPTLQAGTWSIDITVDKPGPYRVYTDFIAKDARGMAHPLVLSTVLTAPGAYTPQPLPAPDTSTTVDGITAAFDGTMTVGKDSDLVVTVTSGGKPVSDLQPYLGTYAHLTAVHAGDAAYRHVHPQDTATAGTTGGPELRFTVDLPEKGSYRFFLQVQRAGVLHTLPVTLRVS